MCGRPSSRSPARGAGERLRPRHEDAAEQPRGAMGCNHAHARTFKDAHRRQRRLSHARPSWRRSVCQNVFLLLCEIVPFHPLAKPASIVKHFLRLSMTSTRNFL
eukprot:43835-Chlamydomonas_euryale.AAC.5